MAILRRSLGYLALALGVLSLVGVGCTGDDFVAVDAGGAAGSGKAGDGGTGTEAGGDGGTTVAGGAGGAGGQGGSGGGAPGGGPTTIACTKDEDCPLPPDACTASFCDEAAGTCTLSPLDRTLPDTIPADCHTAGCIQGQPADLLDTTDTPKPSDPCKVGVCSATGMVDVVSANDGLTCTLVNGSTGACSDGICAICKDGAKGCQGDTPTTCTSNAVVAGKPCQDKTPHCVDAGECVECAVDADCTSKNPCLAGSCVDHHCSFAVAAGRDIDKNPDDCKVQICTSSEAPKAAFVPRGTSCLNDGKNGQCTKYGNCYVPLF
jgi:hypothetical protein